MQQLTQQLKSGKMEVLEVPFPTLYKGHVLVRNHYSVISAGTEGKTVTDARKGYIAKARSRQKEVKQVIDMVKLNGPMATYKLVMNKLEAPSQLGYSTAGEVIAVGEGIKNLKVGDKVACGGGGACHADVIAVSENLCAKVATDVDLKYAAFSTIAAIAIQGMRQADLRMGENCLIIGMGLLGQLTAKILMASGIRPICVDVSTQQVEQSLKSGIKDVYERNAPGLEETIMKFSRGHGVDAIIITAGTSSLDPVELAGTVARKKAKVVIVGAVPTGFDRKNYYKKELDLRMSMSYGPGRGDLDYEQKNIDYPIGYVRWTENRNMQSYLDLLETGALDVEKLISHVYELPEAPNAYDMILSRSEAYNGVLIQYDAEAQISSDLVLSTQTIPHGKPNVAMIGAGNFAQNVLLPLMKDHCNFVGLTTGHGNTAKYVAEKYGFQYCNDSAEQLLKDEKINTVFITTRHDSHAKYVVDCIKSNKHVFVEKPLALTEDELEEVRVAYQESKSRQYVMIGFNRRFAPAVQQIKNLLNDDQPKSINIRVNAGITPPEHWTNDMDIGGGRMIGEGCHFIDLAMFLAGAKITSVSANAMEDPNGLDNTVVVNLAFANGSVASVNYFSNGNKRVAKEQIEVFCGETVCRIDDFKTLTIFGASEKTIKFKGQDKGHQEEIKQFLGAVNSGSGQPISFEECYLSSLATLKVMQSLKEQRTIVL
ncbi:MAG: Gfo/Idh/MocA family oxidoreductase [Roseivirga sp.]|nr:Gfo/Idh/MocA family oxidoreductase [Roseivirga sp.]